MSNAYQSPSAAVAQQQIEHQYMGFWMRVLASILDNIWLGVIIAIVMLVLMMVFPMDSESTEYFFTGGSVNVLLPLVLVIALWIRYASTPGKMAFKAKIVDADTFEPVSNGRLILRYFGYFVSILPLFLGFLWICWDERKQGFHDKIAGTVVVIEK